MANQMTITFNVENQTLSRTDTNKIVEKSKNYLHATFTFSEDWEGTRKAIIVEDGGLKFKVYLDENNSCDIPNKAVSYDGFMVSVIGENIENFVTITTNDLFVSVNKSNATDDEEKYVKYITSNSLDVDKDGETYNLEIPDDFLQENSSDETIGNLDKLLIRGKNYDVKGRKIYIHHLHISFEIGYFDENVLVDVITNDNTPLTYDNFYNYLMEKIGHANSITATGYYNNGTYSTYIYRLYGFHFSVDNAGIRLFLGTGSTYNVPNTATFIDVIVEV